MVTVSEGRKPYIHIRNTRYSAWRAGKPQQHPDREELKQIIHSIEDYETRMLATALFLTGCRISEIVGSKKLFYTVKRKIQNPDGTFTVEKTKQAKTVQGLVKGQLRRNEDGLWTFRDVPVLKRRGGVVDVRDVVVSPKDDDLVKEIASYQDGLSDGKLLFPITRMTAWRWLVLAFGKTEEEHIPIPGLGVKRPLHPHWFRHQTASVKAKYDDLDSIKLLQWFKWLDVKHAGHYASMSTKDLSRHLKKNAEEGDDA